MQDSQKLTNKLQEFKCILQSSSQLHGLRKYAINLSNCHTSVSVTPHAT